MDVYEKLKKIKKPVLIAVYKDDELYKFRILRPNGICTWVKCDNYDIWSRPDRLHLNRCLFEDESCFVSSYHISLEHTVNSMKKYDKDFNDFSMGLVKFTTQLVGTIDL